MKKLFLILLVSFAWTAQARVWRPIDSIEKAESFIYIYYKKHRALPESLEELKKTPYKELDARQFFEGEEESGFKYSLTKLAKNILWLSVEKNGSNYSLLCIADEWQIIMFRENQPLYSYKRPAFGRICDHYAYDKRFEISNGYEGILVQPGKSYEVIEPPRGICE